MLSEDLYFEWMVDTVCGNRYSEAISYRHLLKRLNSIDFTYILPMDSNRQADGIDLRYRYSLETGRQPAFMLYRPNSCSVLEMMVALAIRCEESIMDDPCMGDRTKQWFWGMISSLGLGGMTDDRYDDIYVRDTIDNFLNRNYAPNGKGGLFTIRGCDDDLRKVEIWYQLCWYLDTIT